MACEIARRLWLEVLCCFDVVPNLSSGFHVLLYSCCEDLRIGCGKEISILVPICICWTLLRIRNFSYFDGIQHNISFAMQLVKQLLHDLTLSKAVVLHGRNSVSIPDWVVCKSARRVIKLVYWIRSQAFEYKLNVDGSAVAAPGHSGGGIVIRDSNGLCVAAFSFYLGIGTSFWAELQALKRGIQECCAKGLRNVFIAMDSKIIVDMLTGKATWPWKYYGDLYFVKQMIGSLGYQLHHIYREANSVADHLAKLASSTQLSSEYTSLNLPSFVKGLVALDLKGVFQLGLLDNRHVLAWFTGILRKQCIQKLPFWTFSCSMRAIAYKAPPGRFST